MNALDLITKRLKGNRGLAEKVIRLIEKYVDFNEVESELACDSNEEYWKEVCDGEMSDVSDMLTDNDWYICRGLEEYFENIEHSSAVSGLGDCLLIYMKCKKGLNENAKKNVVKINESTLRRIVTESVKKVLSEISTNLIDRAADAAHKDMMRNWGDLKIMDKRKKQWRNFSDERAKRYTEEKNSVCPYVPESELKNMPSDTFVVMDGNGRNPIDASFTYRYSGHAGTEEQCKEYVDRFYDKGANWEYLPTIMTIKEYSEYNK